MLHITLQQELDKVVLPLFTRFVPYAFLCLLSFRVPFEMLMQSPDVVDFL